MLQTPQFECLTNTNNLTSKHALRHKQRGFMYLSSQKWDTDAEPSAGYQQNKLESPRKITTLGSIKI